MSGFRWSGQREDAALLVAEDRLTNEEIAARVGVTRQALDKWKRHPEFAARVESLVTAMAEAVEARGIANRKRRVAALNDRWRRMLRVIEDRAKEMADVTAGETGLLTRQVKLVKVYVSVDEAGNGSGGAKRVSGALASSRRVVEVAEFAVDVGLLRELREHEKQAAQELGQWDSKEDSGDRLQGVLDEVLRELEEEMA